MKKPEGKIETAEAKTDWIETVIKIVLEVQDKTSSLFPRSKLPTEYFDGVLMQIRALLKREVSRKLLNGVALVTEIQERTEILFGDNVPTEYFLGVMMQIRAFLLYELERRQVKLEVVSAN